MKKVMVIGLCAMFLAITTLSFADEVHVTKNGKKYHKADCQLIKNKETATMSMEDAGQKGLEPCQRCFKDKVLEAQTPKETKKIKTK
jgi:hypothetical protein